MQRLCELWPTKGEFFAVRLEGDDAAREKRSRGNGDTDGMRMGGGADMVV